MIRNHLTFLNLWFGLTISEFGGALLTFSLSLIAYENSGNASDIGLMWILYFLPSLIVQLVSSPYLDRYSKKKILVSLQITKALLIIIFIGLYAMNEAIILLYLLQMILGCITPIYTPISQAMLPDISEEDDLPLYNSLIDGTSKIMIAFSPIVSGVIISFIEQTFSLYISAICFLISGLCLMFLKESVTQKKYTKNSWWSEIKEGFEYYISQKEVLYLGYLLMGVQFTVGVITVITLPYIIDILHGDMRVYGFFMACFPVGYVIGTIIIKLFSKYDRYKIMYGMICVEVLGYIGLGISHSIALSYIIEILSGVALSIFNSYNTSIVQQTIPKAMAGRIFSIRLAIIRFLMPLGILTATLLVGFIGVRNLFLINSLVMVVVMLFVRNKLYQFIKASK